jgi:hypothetical protein
VKRTVFPALAALFLICVPRTGPAVETGRPAPEEIGKVCGTIAAIVAVYPTLEVRKTLEEPDRSTVGGTSRAGCRVVASGPIRGIVGEVPPVQAIRDLLRQSGWKEDPRLAADGPGTASIGLRKDGLLCIVSGGAPSGVEDGKPFTGEKYDLTARCAAEAAGAVRD